MYGDLLQFESIQEQEAVGRMQKVPERKAAVGRRRFKSPETGFRAGGRFEGKAGCGRHQCISVRLLQAATSLGVTFPTTSANLRPHASL